MEQFKSIAASADGRRLVATVANPRASFWSVPPGVSPDGRHVAIAVPRLGKRLLHVLSSDGAELQSLAPAIDVQGSSCWSPDGRWIAVGGGDERGPGLFKVPADGGVARRLVSGTAINPVWSGEGNLIVYAGAGTAAYSPLLAVRPDGLPVQLPAIQIRRGDGERARFLPGDKGLVLYASLASATRFLVAELDHEKKRANLPVWRICRNAQLRHHSDGKEILFDRLNDNSEVVLIDFPDRRK